MTQEQIKHLEFIQNVITRMNTNSFQIKGWNITIVSAIFAIYASTKNNYFLLTTLFPSIIFWLLDSYYLLQERKFRGLYNDVAGITNINTITTFAMRPDLYTKAIDKTYSFWNVYWSTTILKLYLSIIVLPTVLFLYLNC